MTDEPIERRKYVQAHPEILQLVRQVHASQVALEKKLTKHMTDETGELALAIAELMKESFPEGDPSGHRRHHELVIRQAEERAKFWADIRVSTARWGVIGVLTFAIVAMWQAFLKGHVT